MNRIFAFIAGSVWLASNISSFAGEEDVHPADMETFRHNGTPLAASTLSSPGNSEWDKWSVQFGVAVITKNVIDDFLFGDFSRAKGGAGGEVYLLSVSRNVHEFEW
ncbi:MAG: hypothetical protein WD490_04430 [Opitutales bacterium]